MSSETEALIFVFCAVEMLHPTGESQLFSFQIPVWVVRTWFGSLFTLMSHSLRRNNHLWLQLECQECEFCPPHTSPNCHQFHGSSGGLLTFALSLRSGQTVALSGREWEHSPQIKDNTPFLTRSGVHAVFLMTWREEYRV